MARAAKVYANALLVACPHCRNLQPSQGTGTHDDDLSWPMPSAKQPNGYTPGLTQACIACGVDFTLPDLPARVPLTPADR
jgi:hypothetical protein